MLLGARPAGILSRARQRRPHSILGVLLCALLLPGASSAPSARVVAPSVIVGRVGPVPPPTAALQADGSPGDGTRSGGVDAPVGRITPQPILGTAATSLPTSADLSQYNPPVENQGDVASCVAWVTAYYMRGWYARRDGYYPGGGPDGGGGFAPMYVYSQIVKGQNTGTTFSATLDLEVAQGMDTRADYTPGDTNYTTQPTAAQQATAATYKLAGYDTLFVGANQGPAAQQAIETRIAGGDPVGIGLPVYDNFWNADSTHYYVDTANMGANHGNHAVVASKYDANGLWVENQWGTGWGLNGWVELSWSYVNQYVWQAVTIHPAPVSAAPSATPVPPTATGTTTPPIVTSVPPTVTATSLAITATATATPASPTTVVTATSTPAVLAPPASPTATATAIALQSVSVPTTRKYRLRALLRLIRLMRQRHTAEHTRPRRVVHRTGSAAQRRPHTAVKPGIVRTHRFAGSHRHQQQRAAGAPSRLKRELTAGYRLLTAGRPRRSGLL